MADEAASRRGRRSKRKGKRFEKTVADETADWLGVTSGITADDDVQRTRSGGDDCDVGLSEEVQLVFPYWLECKDHKTLAIPAWIKQVKEAQKRNKDTREPVIVFKQYGDGQKYAIVRFECFMELATRHLNDIRKGNCE